MLKSSFPIAAGCSLPLRCISPRMRRWYASSTPQEDYYKTLGVGRDATSKEIKAAFYDLSKKYHPDANPTDRAKSSDKFQQLVDAYEVLGLKTRDGVTMLHCQITDTAKRKRVFYNDNEMPEFFKEVEWSKSFKGTDFRAAAPPKYINYKDSRAFQREESERRMAEELEQIRRMSKYPLPTFEQLLRQEEKLKQESSARLAKLASIGILAVFVVCVCSTRYGI
uniref:J domain-containing protein n=1 Tax=Ditylenchus dipsaci TaxID=166011 RepID=A0A915D3N8_9BILA